MRATVTSAALALLVASAACATMVGAPDSTGSSGDHAACPRTAERSCEGPPPTYSQDILPILRRRCFQCHAADGVAAEDHNFSSFTTFHAQRTTVADQVAACTMPPASQPRLTNEEADAILRWAACGGLEQ
jgi:hypothetical protein